MHCNWALWFYRVKHFEYFSWRIIFCRKRSYLFSFQEKEEKSKKYWLNNNIGIKNRKLYGTKNPLEKKKNNWLIYMDTPEQHTDLSSNVTLKCSRRKDYFFCSCLVIFYPISPIYREWLVGICNMVHFKKMWSPYVHKDEFYFLDSSTSKLSGILSAACPPSYILSLLILCRSS